MKIVFLTKRRYTGRDLINDRYARLFEFIAGLGRVGDRVAMICIKYGRPTAMIPPSNNESPNVDWHLNSTGAGLFWGLPKHVSAAERFAATFGPDVVLSASDAFNVWLGGRLARRLAVPHVADLDDEPVAVNRPAERAKLATRALFEMPFCHISLFARRRAFEQIGPFDTRYRIAADHDFVVQLVREPFEGRDLGAVVGKVAWGGLSSTRQVPKEALRVGLSHGLSPLSGYAFYAWKVMRVTARTSLGLSTQRMLSRLLGTKHEWVK